MYEVLTRWTTAGSPGGVTVMYFSDTADITNVRAKLGVLWAAIDNQLTQSTTWTVDTTGRVLNAATGTLTGFWDDAAALTGAGALNTSAVPNAAQILLRWRTSDIVAGRLVQGRTYVPGMGSGLLANGEIAGASRAAMAAAANTFTQGVNGPYVWHRPKNGSGGSLHQVTSGECWLELAVQRRRRA